LLEGLAARLFAERASDEQVAALRAQVDILRAAFAELDSAEQRIQTMLNVKDRYYDVFLAGCGNEQIRNIHEGLQARVRLMRATSLGRPDRPDQTLTEIDAVVTAIEARDPEAAEKAAKTHVERAAEQGLEGLMQHTEDSASAPAS
jgi:DNA-binding GntR family transcriptional regulator